MTRRRVIFALASLAWLAGVYWYWRENVPLVPTRTIKFPASVRVIGFSESGEAVVARVRQRPYPDTESLLHGPIEFWTFPEGLKTRELLTTADSIELDYILPTREIIARQNGRFSTLDIETGEPILHLGATTRVLIWAPLTDGRRIAYCDGHIVRMHDRTDDRELWNAPESLHIHDIGHDYIVVGRARSGRGSIGWGSLGIRVLNLATGLPDDRFDHLGKVHMVRSSSDGRLAAVETSPMKLTMCDARSGHAIWSAQLNNGSLFVSRFDDGSQQLQVDYTDQATRRRMIDRWNTDDGSSLEPIPATESRSGWPLLASNSRYGIAYSSNASAAKSWINKQLQRRSFRISLPDFPPTYSLFEFETSRRIGTLGSAFSSTNIRPDGSGVIVTKENHLAYYSFPPSRNWPWLAAWSLLPPACVFLLHRRRRRRRALIASPIAQD